MITVFYYILSAMGYAAVGLLWSFFNWKKYVGQELAFYEEEKRKFLASHRVRGIDIPDYLVFEWRSYVKSSVRMQGIPPKPTDFRGEIVFDAMCWPLALSFAILKAGFEAATQRIVAAQGNGTKERVEKIRKDLGI